MILERIYDVLDFDEDEEIVDAYAYPDKTDVHIDYQNINDYSIGHYIADFSDRPHALAYIKGIREDFDD